VQTHTRVCVCVCVLYTPSYCFIPAGRGNLLYSIQAKLQPGLMHLTQAVAVSKVKSAVPAGDADIRVSARVAILPTSH
jgi:hypothetical protein